MSEQYKIQLGIKLDDSDLSKEVKRINGFSENKKINLGIHLKTSEINQQITKFNGNTNTAKLKLGIKLDDKGLKDQIKNLKIGDAKTGVSLNTQSLEKSLNEVAASIKEIKASLGTLNNASGMKSLLSSVNQIATALGKAENESDNLLKSLNALASKDFNINFGIDMGKKNNNMIAYGRAARKQVIPELESQIKDLESLFGGQQATMKKLASQGKDIGFDIFTDFEDFGSDSAVKKMEAMEKYINSLKKLAALDNNIDLNGFNKTHKDASTLINDITGVENAVDKAGDVPEKIKNIFGSGIDAEGLSKVLDPIIQDLRKIGEFINNLSENNSIDNLSASFNDLSTTLNRLMTNADKIREIFDSGLVDMSKLKSDNNIKSNVDEVIQAEEKKQQAIKETTDAIKNQNFTDNVGDNTDFGASKIKQEFQSVEVEINDTENQVRDLQSALQSLGVNNDNTIKRISREFDELGVTAKKVTVELQDDIPVRIIVDGVDDLKDAIKVKASLDEELGIDGGISKTASKAVNDYTADIKKLEETATKIKNLKISIGKLDANSNVNEINVLERELEELEHTYQDLRNKLRGKIPDGQLDPVAKDAKEVENVLNRLEAQLADTKTKLAKKIEIQIETGKFSTQVEKVKKDVQKLSSMAPELQSAFKQLEVAESAMNIAKKDGNVDKLKNAYDKYKVTLETVENQIKQASIAQDEFNRKQKEAANIQKLDQYKQSLSLKMDNWLKDNSKAAKMFGGEIQDLQTKLKNCTNIDIARSIGRDFDIVTAKAKSAGVATKTFTDSLRGQWEHYKSYLSIASLTMYVSQGLRDMFEQVRAIDSAMTELKKVTDETDAIYNQFLDNAATRAKEIGTTIDGLVSSTADFARLGYSISEASQLAEVANIYAVVGDEIDSVETATSSLISTMTAFGIEASDSISIVDKFNEVGNNFAISSGGIGDALERSASSMSAANNSLDESIALITAANTVVQDADAVGTAFKTISMRIRGAKTDLEDAGLDTEGMASSTAKLREEIMALSGVDIMLDSTTFKSTYKIIEELADKWEHLTDIQQASITELIAGKVFCQNAQKCA